MTSNDLKSGKVPASMVTDGGAADVSGMENVSPRRTAGPGRGEQVFLSGLRRGATEPAIKLAVRAAAEAATDFSWLSKGDAVFIKPSHNSGNPYPATANPAAIAAIVELLREKGAGRVVLGDMGGADHVHLSPNALRGSTRRLMEASGMAQAAQAAGAELFFFEEAGWDAFHPESPCAGSHWRGPLMMPDILNEVQHIVLMPRCARHALAGSSCGLKGAVGYWRLDTRLEFHHDAATLQEKVAEANTVDSLLGKQRLVVSAANKILVTYGPDKGRVDEPEEGLVIASKSVVAHDMVCLAWLLEHWQRVPSSDKTFFKDPYNYQLAVTIGNHYIAGLLGGLLPFFTAQKLTRNDIASIWQDRVLRRAFEVFGGVPSVSLEEANAVLSEPVTRRLREATTPPAENILTPD